MSATDHARQEACPNAAEHTGRMSRTHTQLRCLRLLADLAAVPIEGGGQGMSAPILVEHEIAPACEDIHCWWHNIDEPAGGRAYRLCFECGHLYRTAGELRRQYRRKLFEHMEPKCPLIFSDEWSPSKLWHVWRALTIRASRITFCQFCTHDW